MLTIRVIATIVVNVVFTTVAFSILEEHDVPHAEFVIALLLIAGFNFGVMVCNVALYFLRRNDS